MFVASFPSAAFGTNVYVVAPQRGEQCVIIDPGLEVAAGVEEILRDAHLEPVAVLLTHGHIDHTFSVIPVGQPRGLPAYIHAADRELLADPMKGISRQTQEMFGGRLDWVEPDDVRVIDGSPLELAGLTMTIDHAPGHTPGSVMFRMAGSPEGQEPMEQTLISGDVLFAGSIGRTDLPGGSHAQMMDSLQQRVLTLPDDVVVLPGHGPQTTIGAERATNPFLQAINLPEESAMSPTRGL